MGNTIQTDLTSRTTISLNQRYITFIIIVTVLAVGHFNVQGLPQDIASSLGGNDLPVEEANHSSDHIFVYSIAGVIISIVLVFSLVVVLSLCSGGCWPINKIFRNREPDFAGGFSNPIRDSRAVAISQIDVNALELDPVVFEPLPTLHNLSPLGGRFQTSNQCGFGNSTLERVTNGAIVPFVSDEANIYAHDWFVEPFHNFPRGNLEYFKQMGKAWFGQVIEAEARDIVPYAKKIKVVVKVLREDAGGLEQMRFLDESRLYRESDHGNVLKLLGHSIEMSPFLLIMESCPLGNLKSFLIANVIRAEMLNFRGEVIRWCLDVARGLEWMASAGFTHGDLAARNCQVGSEGRVIIGDYGLSTQTFKDDYYWSANIAIPLRWAAPETLHCTINTIQTLKVTNASNVWSFAVTLYEVCEFGKLPYFELTDDEVIGRVIIDKSYVLGRPTLPSLCMRENLCEIMQECWKPIADERPSMTEIVLKLEYALQSLQGSGLAKNDFDLKWDQVAPKNGPNNTTPKAQSQSKIFYSKSPNESANSAKRKSVSFLGEEQIFTDVALSQNSSNDHPEHVDTLFTQKICDETVFSNTSDPEDEHWRARIERGDISEKVRVKSQSVQDLMILTHVEPSELSDPESFTCVNKEHSPLRVTTPSAPHQSPVLRKSFSETALNTPGMCAPNTSQPPSVISVNTLAAPVVPEVKSPTVVNSSGVTINLIEATPNPSVAINVIQSTPSPAGFGESDTQDSPLDAAKPADIEKIKKRFKFIFDEDANCEPYRVRHTSTPIRTPSPSLRDDISNSRASETQPVFDSPQANAGGIFDGSCSISPISRRSKEVSFPTDGKWDENSSILMGPSDELGLEPYQAVTTEMEDRSLAQNVVQSKAVEKRRKIFEELSESDSKIFESSFNSEADVIETGESKSLGTANKIGETRRLDLNMIPRNLFADRGDAEAGISQPTTIPVSRCSWTLINDSNSKYADVSCTQSWVVFSKDGSKIVPAHEGVDPSSHSAELGCNGNSAEEGSEAEDFWSKQMKSVKEATGNTLALFQLGLGVEQDDVANSKDKITPKHARFIQDIEAVSKESDSLILHDLEDEKCSPTFIGREKETLSDLPSSSDANGTAFGGSVKIEPISDSESKTESDEGEFDDSNFVKTLNNSIEVSKNAGTPALRRSKEVEEMGDADSDTEEKIYPEFVPSMWNQNLAPVKPSLKSPEIVEGDGKNDPLQYPEKRSGGSGMRKSVSFEQNKAQLVYQYPAQIISDSDEEDTKPHFGFGGPLALALDWELQPDELGDAQFNNDDWEDDVRPVKAIKREDPYKISGVDDQFSIKEANQPFGMSSSADQCGPSHSPGVSSLGELRHTRDKLKLDLSRGEASVLDEDTKNSRKLDSGVGSSTSTNMSPFTQCDK